MDNCGNDVREKLLENFENNGDVTFSVGPEKEEIKSCVLVLRTLSPVFDKMFNESWNSQKTKVELPDIEPQVFRHFLKLMLKNKLTVEELNGLNLSVEEILHMLYIADKYDVQSILQVCRDSVKKNIRSKNAVLIYETVQKMIEPTLENSSFKFITEKITKIVKDESFTKLSRGSLMKILTCQDIKIDELQLFIGVFRWAEIQCKDVGLEPNAEYIRSALGEILFLLRFPVMSHEEFFQVVYPRGILTSEEVIAISRCIALKGNPSFVNDCPFDSKDRMKNIPKYGQCFKFCPCERVSLSGVEFLGGINVVDSKRYTTRLCILDNNLDMVCHESSLIKFGREFQKPFWMNINPSPILEKEHVYHFQFDLQDIALFSGPEWNAATSIQPGLSLKSIQLVPAP